MEFEWDEEKRQVNLIKHNIDFEDARDVFDGRDMVKIPSLYPFEERNLTVGVIAGRYITVIWTQRDMAIRIISARSSRDSEKRAHRSIYG